MASFADTGQWRLIITVSYSGISAVLKNVLEPSFQPVPLLYKEWEADDSSLLQLVEDAVYDNPKILDDYATQILVYTPKSLWIPEELTDEEEFDEKYYTSVYEANEEDIFADFGSGEVCLYSLAPGLKSFFQRTLPGCKITSHLSVLKNQFESLEKNTTGRDGALENGIYINCREKEIDLFAFRHGQFMSGSTHNWKSIYDIIYRTLLLSRVYGLLAYNTRIMLLGSHPHSEGLVQNFRKFFPSVSVKKIPELTARHHLPLAAAIAAGEKIE